MTREDQLLMVAALKHLLNDHYDKLGDPKYTTELANRIALLMDRKDEKYITERKIRYKLLDRHGWKGVLVGILIIIGGAPTIMENTFGLWVRPLLGYTPLIAGTLLLVGQRLYHNGIPERIGLILAGTWDLVFGLAFIFSLMSYNPGPGGWQLNWPWELGDLPQNQPVLYAPVVYFALAAMLWGPHYQAMVLERKQNRQIRRLSEAGITGRKPVSSEA